VKGLDHRSHGGNLRALAEASGLPAASILDFSANLSPLGPPPWLGEAVAEGAARVGAYPDPDSLAARAAASRRFGLPAGRFLFADGADSLIFALPRALGVASCLAFSPTYSGYLRACTRAGIEPILVPLREERGFAPDWEALLAAARRAPGPVLAWLGAPNNPVGGAAPAEAVRRLASSREDIFILLDESFAELSGDLQGLAATAPRNVLVARSLTKTYAVPGARVGFLAGEPGLLAAVRAELPAWPLSSFGEAIATRALADEAWAREGARLVAAERGTLVAALGRIGTAPALGVYPGPANFLLVRFPGDSGAVDAARALLARGIATRTYGPEEGLDGRFMRLAVRTGAENARLAGALAEVMREATR